MFANSGLLVIDGAFSYSTRLDQCRHQIQFQWNRDYGTEGWSSKHFFFFFRYLTDVGWLGLTSSQP